MASRKEISLFSHLMRRAGFGESRREIEALAKRNYEDVVEELIEPGDGPAIDEYRLYRYHPMVETLMRDIANGQFHWLYHMVNSKRPASISVGTSMMPAPAWSWST